MMPTRFDQGYTENVNATLYIPYREHVLVISNERGRMRGSVQYNRTDLFGFKPNGSGLQAAMKQIDARHETASYAMPEEKK